MTKDELIQRLKEYEWDDFECKKAQKSVSKDAYTTVSAFASLEELLKTTEKEVRNPAIISAFRRIGLSDQGDTGIHAIFKNWNDIGRVPPRIENDKAGKTFLITLESKPLVSDEMRRFQQKIGVKLTKDQANNLGLRHRRPYCQLYRY